MRFSNGQNTHNYSIAEYGAHIRNLADVGQSHPISTAQTPHSLIPAGDFDTFPTRHVAWHFSIGLIYGFSIVRSAAIYKVHEDFRVKIIRGQCNPKELPSKALRIFPVLDNSFLLAHDPKHTVLSLYGNDNHVPSSWRLNCLTSHKAVNTVYTATLFNFPDIIFLLHVQPELGANAKAPF
jgi:hypothetical protein